MAGIGSLVLVRRPSRASAAGRRQREVLRGWSPAVTLTLAGAGAAASAAVLVRAGRCRCPAGRVPRRCRRRRSACGRRRSRVGPAERTGRAGADHGDVGAGRPASPPTVTVPAMRAGARMPVDLVARVADRRDAAVADDEVARERDRVAGVAVGGMVEVRRRRADQSGDRLRARGAAPSRRASVNAVVPLHGVDVAVRHAARDVLAAVGDEVARVAGAARCTARSSTARTRRDERLAEAVRRLEQLAPGRSRSGTRRSRCRAAARRGSCTVVSMRTYVAPAARGCSRSATSTGRSVSSAPRGNVKPKPATDRARVHEVEQVVGAGRAHDRRLAVGAVVQDVTLGVVGGVLDVDARRPAPRSCRARCRRCACRSASMMLPP